MTKPIFVSFFVITLFALSAFANSSYPDRFAQLDEYIYRGARPNYEQLITLKKLYLVKTIVSLEDNPAVVAQERAWANQLGMKFYSFPIDVFENPRDGHINAVLTELLKSSKTNRVYLHCRQGKDRTGLVAALHRVFYQNWNKDRAYDEMLQMGFEWLLYPLRRYFWYRTQSFR